MTVPDHDVPLPVKVTAGVPAPEKVTIGAAERLSLAVTDMVTVADDLNGPVPDDPSRNVTVLADGAVLSTVSADDVPVWVLLSVGSVTTTSSFTRTADASNEVTARVPEIAVPESEMSDPTESEIDDPVISVDADVSEYWRSVALVRVRLLSVSVPPKVRVFPSFTAVCEPGATSVGVNAVGVAKARPGQANSTVVATATTHRMPIARAWRHSQEASPRVRAGQMFAFREESSHLGPRPRTSLKGIVRGRACPARRDTTMVRWPHYEKRTVAPPKSRADHTARAGHPPMAGTLDHRMVTNR